MAIPGSHPVCPRQPPVRELLRADEFFDGLILGPDPVPELLARAQLELPLQGTRREDLESRHHLPDVVVPRMDFDPDSIENALGDDWELFVGTFLQPAQDVVVPVAPLVDLQEVVNDRLTAEP